MVRLHEWEGMWSVVVLRHGCCIVEGVVLDEGVGFGVIEIDRAVMPLVVVTLLHF